jgi:hypothetical protein
MQPIESIETINHSSNLDSKNKRRQTKQLTCEFVCQSLKSPPMILTSPLRKLELLIRPIPRQVSFNHFSHSTKLLLFFLPEVNQTLTNFPKTHHTLESSRAMPSHLGGFTSKSNKCHENCYTKFKCLKVHKEDSLSTQT